MGKYVHVCPYCNVAKGFRGEPSNPNLTCLSCGREVSWKEWRNAPVIPKPEYVDYFREHPDKWSEIICG